MADRHSGDSGRKLREARERRGMTLRQVAEATRISVRALESLERNDIARLPGGISAARSCARMPSKWALHRRRQFRSSSRNFPTSP